MLLGDEKLKGKIKPNDISIANFIIMNLGEKTQTGSSIDIIDAQETDKNIILTVKENDPQTNSITLEDYIYPYCIIKINSKKEIIIK